MFKLGLTGSIGMGKSTTANLFSQMGCAVWDADAAVHRLYEAGGDAVDKIAEIFPQAIENNQVSRDALREIIMQDRAQLQTIETIVHPLVGHDRQKFIENATSDILVFDIPLLFETKGERDMDAVACVWCDEAIQEQRVLARNTMTLAEFHAIRDKQMPISEKKARADYLIETDRLDHATLQVKNVLAAIHQRINNA